MERPGCTLIYFYWFRISAYISQWQVGWLLTGWSFSCANLINHAQHSGKLKAQPVAGNWQPATDFTIFTEMLVQGNFIDYQGSRLHYAKAGLGTVPMLIFHGFGQDNLAFKSWESTLKNEYCLYVFDLYFHGQSTWPHRRPLEKSDWRQITSQFLIQEKIESFVVAGFSLGAKFALATLESFPDKVKKVILLAPDGIKTNLWYSFATYPIVIRRLFKTMVFRPGRFFTMAHYFQRMGLVNKGLLRFVESQMDTEERRKRVYFSWVYFRHLKFNVSEIAALLNHHRIPLLLIVGKYDKVILAENMDQLTRRLDQKQFEVIEAGHNDVIEKVLSFITKENSLP